MRHEDNPAFVRVREFIAHVFRRYSCEYFFCRPAPYSGQFGERITGMSDSVFFEAFLFVTIQSTQTKSDVTIGQGGKLVWNSINKET